MQWSEQHLTYNKADPCHRKGVSFNNCMFRVPGSINSKVNRQVTIVQRWNGIRLVSIHYQQGYRLLVLIATSIYENELRVT
jgi:hypothetical protein